MNFFETVMGRRFYENSVPRLIKAVERVAGALEKANDMEERKTAGRASLRDAMLNRILRFAKEEDFGEGNICQSHELCRKQLRSLWTAYCICNHYEVDTGTYDSDIAKVWDAVIENRKVLGSEDIFDDFDCFDEFMCEELV